MRVSALFAKIMDGLMAAGGLGASAELGLDDFGTWGHEPCPRVGESPCRSNLEAMPCPAPLNSSPCLPGRPSR